MRIGGRWRARALTVARHAAAAAGLGAAWILLSGAPANAAIPSPGDLVGGIVAPAPSATASGPMSSVPATTAALASDPGGTLAGLTGTTTSTATSLAGAAPTAVAPLTGGPASPLAPVITPVVEGTTSLAVEAVGAVGGTVGSVAQGTGDALAPVAQPVGQVLETTTAPAPARPVPGLADIFMDTAPAASTPLDHPGGDSPAGEPMRQDPLAGEAGLSAAATARPTPPAMAGAFVLDGAAMVASGTGSGWPDLPRDPVIAPAPAPTSGESSPSGAGGGSGAATALGASAFSLMLLSRAGGRLGHAATRLPASPSFDPGSTPD
ncbi:hypothetical protein [Sinomonas sp. P10A9]|uniref:Uncharacterized protein n=1 Tax=Sinomonas puerhi TaxID=3238584 RepID=A0AB39L5V6_9MICC